MSSMIMPAMMMGSSLLKAGTQIEAGELAEKESEAEAKQIELAAVQQEADRKRRLAQSLSTSIARGGASGVMAFEGSPLSILQESVQQEEKATQRQQFQTGLAAKTKRAQGFFKRKQAERQAISGLISGGFQTASIMPKQPISFGI